MKKLMMVVVMAGLVLFVGCDDKKVKQAVEEAKTEMQLQTATQIQALTSIFEGRIAKLEEEKAKLQEENADLKQKVAARVTAAPTQRPQQGQASTQQKQQNATVGRCRHCGQMLTSNWMGLVSQGMMGLPDATCASSPTKSHILQ